MNFEEEIAKLKASAGPSRQDVEAAKFGILAMAGVNDLPAVVPVGPGVGLCLHLGATTVRRQGSPRWRKSRSGCRWRGSWLPGRAFLVRRCPDCPAHVIMLDTGAHTEVTLPAWYVPDADRVGAAVAVRRRGDPGVRPGVSSSASPWGGPWRRAPSSGCYERSWGWVHMKPGCRCVR